MISPRDVYGAMGTKAAWESVLTRAGYRVIDFRPSVDGETFLGKYSSPGDLQLVNVVVGVGKGYAAYRWILERIP